MKHFEPIVIQEETDVRYALFVRVAEHETDFIEIVQECIGQIELTYQAAIRLRDALNTILND